MLNCWSSYRAAVYLGCAVFSVACVGNSQAAGEDDGNICRPAGSAVRLSGLPEASGITLGRGEPRLLWSHNDSAEPVLLGISLSGAITRRLSVTGAMVTDWEDISAGPCPGGACLYIADIGDNNRRRRDITVYRVPEPEPGDTETARADAFAATYPDGPHDAEALFVTSAGELFIITKEKTATLYRWPSPLSPGAAVTLERVASLPMTLVTAADTSPDGTWLAIRTGDELVFHRTRELLSGTSDGIRVALRALKEPQGEGVALGADGTVYLVSEGGGGGGSFRTLQCTLP